MNAKLKAWLRRFFNRLLFGLLVFLFLLIVFWNKMVYVVPNGWGAVNWNPVRPWINRRPRFSLGEAANSVGEGIHIIPPWNQFFLYDLRLQSYTHTYQAVSQEGLHFEMDMTFRWRAFSDDLVRLNKDYGQDYLHSMLIPEVGSQLRKVVAAYSAEDLYSENRQKIQDEVFHEITMSSNPNHITSMRGRQIENDEHTVELLDVLISTVRLPERIKRAIEDKLAEAERVEQTGFRVQREKLESQRKAIEAEGIQKFQQTVNPSITDSYLRWRGIEATLELAKSPNSKVVVIGSGEQGLPIILGNQDGTFPAHSTKTDDANPAVSDVQDAVKK